MTWTILELGLRYNVLGYFVAHALSWGDELILRAVGVALALLGAVLTSPHGWKRMLFLSRFWLKALVIRVQMWLSKYFKFIPRPSTTVYPGSALSGGGIFTARVMAGIYIPADATPERKIELLEVALKNLHAVVNGDYENLDKKISDVKALVSEVNDKTAELQAKMVKAQEEAASIDAAGIPVIAAGVLLSGIPKELAMLPSVGWAILAGSMYLAIAMTRKTIKDGAWGKKGSEA